LFYHSIYHLTVPLKDHFLTISCHINGPDRAFPPISLSSLALSYPNSSTAATVTWPNSHPDYLYLYSNFIFGSRSGVDDVNRAKSVLTRPPIQNVLLVWYTLLLLDDSLPLVEHNILLDQEPKMEVACYSETLVPTYMLHDSEVNNLNTILKFSQT
jgi:hypothetical protein